MSGIVLGALAALLGVLLFTAAQPAGLVFVVVGFVSLFSGMASEQDQKRLRSGQLHPLAAPIVDEATRARVTQEDTARAEAVYNAPTLSVISAPAPMQSGEVAYFHTPATVTEVRRPHSVAGGYMAWDTLPAASEVGELYVTTHRLIFLGARETRDIPLAEIASTTPGYCVLQIQRQQSTCPILFAVQFPRELAAFIERSRNAAGMSAIPSSQSDAPPSPSIQMTNSTSASSSAFIICEKCGSANGLSANFCQNCAAPIQGGKNPTLQYPTPGA